MNKSLQIISLLLIAAIAQKKQYTAEAAPIISNLNDLPYNSDNRLAKHIFAYPTGKCATLINEETSIHDGQWGHTFMELDGEAYTSVFGHLDVDTTKGVPKEAQTFHDCTAVCLEMGTPQSVVARPLPHRYWNKGTKNDEEEIIPVNSIERFLTSDSCGQVEYGFINYHTNIIKLYWIGNDGKPLFNQDIGVGERETSFITTFIGHTFHFYDSLPNEDDPTQNELMYVLNVESHGVVGIKNHKQPYVHPSGVVKEVERTMESEWKRHLKVKRTFSPLGFDKGRLPDDMYASLSSYYYNNRSPPHKVLEEWGRHKGVFVNYWETDVNFIQIPWHLKKRWQTRLLRLVEAWTGVELDITDMYGMREYTKGARLLTHVDRESTHAASLIVNIAQEDVVKPWTVEVYDHADRLHEVVMEPGDIVYYESAKCLHSRNTPLESGTYINLFTHYRPVDDPEWYRRANPEGTPSQLLDVGNCKLTGKIDQYSQGAVTCDKSAIGPHLSPTMFKANNSADLFQWWKRVGPEDDGTVLDTSDADDDYVQESSSDDEEEESSSDDYEGGDEL